MKQYTILNTDGVVPLDGNKKIMNAVNYYINNGWSLYGQPFIHPSDGTIFQAVIKE